MRKEINEKAHQRSVILFTKCASLLFLIGLNLIHESLIFHFQTLLIYYPSLFKIGGIIAKTMYNFKKYNIISQNNIILQQKEYCFDNMTSYPLKLLPAHSTCLKKYLIISLIKKCVMIFRPIVIKCALLRS